MGHNVATHYYQGQGVVMMGEYDANGKVTGLETLGNCTSLQISPEITKAEHKESWSGMRAVDITWVTETKLSGTIQCEEWGTATLRKVLQGATTAVATGTATGETLLAYPGKIGTLAHMGVSALTLVAGSTNLVPWADGLADGEWDYKLYADGGSVEFAKTPVSTTLTEGVTVTAGYTYKAQTMIGAMAETGKRRYLRFEGLNTVRGMEPLLLECWQCEIDPPDNLDFLTEQEDSVASYQLNFTLFLDPKRSKESGQFFTVTQLAE